MLAIKNSIAKTIKLLLNNILTRLLLLNSFIIKYFLPNTATNHLKKGKQNFTKNNENILIRSKRKKGLLFYLKFQKEYPAVSSKALSEERDNCLVLNKKDPIKRKTFFPTRTDFNPNNKAKPF